VENVKILTNDEAANGPVEQRHVVDRRSQPTPPLSRYTFFGRRRRNRRAEDPQKNYYVDWAAGPYLWMLYAVVLLVAFDAVATWMIIRQGVEEGNALVAWLIDLGPVAFWTVKLALLPAFMILLAVKRFFPWARILVWIVFVSYAALAAFHLSGIYRVLKA